ncbi:MAG: MoxR family ATPase [Chloroflexi bacterium]|nr:MoxR family ATPase [Chloroflexota bacterium]
MKFKSIDSLQSALQDALYFADRGLATAIYLALKIKRPLFLEGAPGVGKTEVAKVIASLYETELIRLQCYEGLDVHHAVYEWNYTRQMLSIRLMEAGGEQLSNTDLFSTEFLLRRPLLQAIDNELEVPPVLLVDEIDRSDEEFEAFLLEVLSDFQISIPEIGTIKAKRQPIVIITSNRTREVHDALKRRCIYNWIEYPTLEKELEIVLAKVPEAPKQLAQQVVRFMQAVRDMDLYKLPGVSETLDWTSALVALDTKELDARIVDETIGVILKYRDDINKVRGEAVQQIVNQLKNAG